MKFKNAKAGSTPENIKAPKKLLQYKTTPRVLESLPKYKSPPALPQKVGLHYQNYIIRRVFWNLQLTIHKPWNSPLVVPHSFCQNLCGEDINVVNLNDMYTKKIHTELQKKHKKSEENRIFFRRNSNFLVEN